MKRIIGLILSLMLIMSPALGCIAENNAPQGDLGGQGGNPPAIMDVPPQGDPGEGGPGGEMGNPPDGMS